MGAIPRKDCAVSGIEQRIVFEEGDSVRCGVEGGCVRRGEQGEGGGVGEEGVGLAEDGEERVLEESVFGGGEVGGSYVACAAAGERG